MTVLEGLDYEGIRAIFVAASGLPATNVRWSHEGVPFVAQLIAGKLIGLLTLSVTADNTIGSIDDFVRTFDEDSNTLRTKQVSRGDVTISGKLIEFGPTKALNRMRLIKRHFNGIRIPSMVFALNMSVKDTPQIRYLDTAIDDKAHSTTVFDLVLNWCTTADVTEELGNADGTDGWIERVEPLTGPTVGGQTMIVVANTEVDLTPGDVVTMGSSVSDAQKVTKWSMSARTSGLRPAGVAISPAFAQGPVSYAAMGSIVSGSLLGLGAGSVAGLLALDNGRTARRGTPATTDVVLGVVNSRGHGFLNNLEFDAAVNPFEPEYQVDAGSASATAGHCVAITNTGTVTLATTAALQAAGAVLGVAADDITPGAFIHVIEERTVDAVPYGVTTSGNVRCNPFTGELEVIEAQFNGPDYPVGTSNQGKITMVRGLALNTTGPYQFAQDGGLVGLYDPALNYAPALWQDQTATHNDFVQASGSHQSVRVNNVLNGKPVVRMTVGGFQCPVFHLNSNEFTVYMVGQLYLTSDIQVILGYDTTTVVLDHDDAGLGKPKFQRGGGSAIYDFPVGNTGFAIRSVQCRADGSNEMFYRGQSVGTFTDTTPIPPTGTLDVGQLIGPSFTPHYDLAYMLVFNKAHSTTVRTKVETQLGIIFAL